MTKWTGTAAESSTALSDVTRTEVLRLAHVDGLSVRAIARRLSLARKTVRKILGRGPASKRAFSELPHYSLLVRQRTRLRRLLPDGKPR